MTNRETRSEQQSELGVLELSTRSPSSLPLAQVRVDEGGIQLDCPGGIVDCSYIVLELDVCMSPGTEDSCVARVRLLGLPRPPTRGKLAISIIIRDRQIQRSPGTLGQSSRHTLLYASTADA